MRLSYSWLKQLVPDLKLSPEKLGEILSMKTAEVEGIVKLGKGLEKVVVAEILSIKPHPRADKLKIATVKTAINDKLSVIEVVCGAPNIKSGQKVPLALPGAKLSNGVEIKPTVIRGVKSQGMLCAEDELGIGPDHQGIYILPQKTKIGQPIAKVLGLDDTIIEAENKSLTHRPDLFNHYGFAREIGAILEVKCKFENLLLKFSARGGPADEAGINKTPIQVKVLEKELCPRYLGVMMEGVKIKDSPDWLQNRLRHLDIKPINNVVDITNYVLAEVGQPLHAFDFDKLKCMEKSKIKPSSRAQVDKNQKSKIQIRNQKAKKIIIRRAREGEKILALDGQEYELTNDDLVIADEQKPVALAGIIGGEKSGITENTQRIFIESANFDSANIRRTSWRLGLRTEAALRFEKGLPMIFPEWGLLRAVKLVQELAQGKIASKVYNLTSEEADRVIKQKREIVFDLERAKKFIGGEIKNETIKKILKSLGCDLKLKGKSLKVIPPAYRPDLNLFEDLIEEVVRLYGAEKIVPQPILAKIEPSPLSNELILEKEIKDILVGLGFDEVYNYSFESRIGADKDADKRRYISVNPRSNQRESALLELANPLNKEQQYLRTSLIPGLLKNARDNKVNFSDFKIFEIGKIFHKFFPTNYESKRITNKTGECKKVAGLIFSQDKNIHFIIKGVIEFIFDKIGIDKKKIKYKLAEPDVVDVYLDEDKFGYFSLPQNNLAVFELDFENLLELDRQVKRYQPIPAYPPIKRDFAFLVDKNISWQEIAETVTKIDPLIQRMELFDVFEAEEFGQKRNIAFHIIYQSLNKTLKSEEIKKIEERIIKTLEKKFNAQFRNF